MMYSKTLILSSQNRFLTNSPRAILTIFSGHNSTGKIRLYNLEKLNDNVKLGVYYNNKVYTSALKKVDDHYEFSINEDLNMNLDIYCALVDTGNKNEVVLCGGSYSGVYFTDEEPISPLRYIDDEFDEEIDNAINQFDTNGYLENQDNFIDRKEHQVAQDHCHNCCKNTDETEKAFTNIDDTHTQFSNNKLSINEQDLTLQEKNCKDCRNCEYKDYFFNTTNQTTQLQNTSDIQTDKNLSDEVNKDTSTQQYSEHTSPIYEQTDTQRIDTAEGEQFFASIVDQLEQMFKEYPLDENLMKIIPNSQIIKVEDSFDNTSYIVGTMYDDEKIKYLLYGVPARYNTAPPKELGTSYQWLPVDPDDPMSDGYYIVYTDITTGKPVPIRVE